MKFSLFFPTFSWWSIINEVSAQIVTKIAKCWRCYLKVCENSPKFVAKICWIVDVGEVQRNANLIDLVKSFQTSIYLQNLASIQPRTSHLIFIILAASRDLIFTERSSPLFSLLYTYVSYTYMTRFVICITTTCKKIWFPCKTCN